MARVNVLEKVTYGRVSYLCALTSCDAHILASTLWVTTPDIIVVAGVLVGAQQYHCVATPCIVDDTSKEPKIWYAGIIDDYGVPIIWAVEHVCKSPKQSKQTEYHQWSVTPKMMLVCDAKALRIHMRQWVSNSMAAACIQRKALDWAGSQLGLSLSDYGWEAQIDLRTDPLLKANESTEE